MVKHIVMFKLSEKTKDNIDKAVQALRGMEGKIETLRFIEVGVDTSESERSYDIVLTTEFDNTQGLKTYITHPNHIPVAETMRSLCSSSVVVDYELG